MRNFVLALVLVMALAVPVMADDGYVYYYADRVIDPADAFDKSKLTRTFILNGEEYEDLAVVDKHGQWLRLWWFSEWLTEYHGDFYRLIPDGMSEVEHKERVLKWLENDKSRFVEIRVPPMYDYPRYDIISINGEPWQNTEYADVIIAQIDKDLKPGEVLKDQNTEVWAMFMDPRTNGGSHVWFGDPDDPGYLGNGFSKVLNYTVDDVTKHNPLNNGKPFDFDSWQWQGTSRPSTGPEEVPPTKEIVETFPNPEWQQGAVLIIGSPQVTIVNAGASKQNVLSVAPETISGRTMIPLRGVLDELGYQLDYDGEREAVEVVGHEQVIILVLGRGTAVVDGKEIELDQPATIKNGRTLVPLRFVSENLGFKVDYDNGKITLSR